MSLTNLLLISFFFFLITISSPFFFFFFFNDTATTEIYTLSLHDALPISYTDLPDGLLFPGFYYFNVRYLSGYTYKGRLIGRSEEHTSELQSLAYLVCRLLLEKKKKKILNM